MAWTFIFTKFCKKQNILYLTNFYLTKCRCLSIFAKANNCKLIGWRDVSVLKSSVRSTHSSQLAQLQLQGNWCFSILCEHMSSHVHRHTYITIILRNKWRIRCGNAWLSSYNLVHRGRMISASFKPSLVYILSPWVRQSYTEILS